MRNANKSPKIPFRIGDENGQVIWNPHSPGTEAPPKANQFFR